VNNAVSVTAEPSQLLWILRRIEVGHAILVGLAALAAATLSGAGAANGVILGGALISLNVWLLKHIFAFLIRRGSGQHRLAIALLFAKLPVLWGLFWLITRVRLVPIDGLGLAAGISCFPVAVVAVTLVWHGRPRQC
jgi:hypothetical protein